MRLTSLFVREANWSIGIRAWKFALALALLAILLAWYAVVHQEDEILSLVRNEVAIDGAGQRTWIGSFVNTNDRSLRDVAVTVDFLDTRNRTVGKVDAAAAELPFNARLELQARLPAEAARIRIHSVQWRMGTRSVLMGPFREPWDFGYLMSDPAPSRR